MAAPFSHKLSYGKRICRQSYEVVSDVAWLHLHSHPAHIEVTLYWLALRETGQDTKSFVHVLGADGSVMAQHDGDPVGGFTPTTRWRPREIIVDRHVVPLPPDLSPGEYSLRAGMYQTDPLRNLTVEPATPDDRVDVGTVTIER